ncbi:MAG: alpha/beta hydrolase [Chloroflexota bacterium]
MPKALINGVNLYYEISGGAGPSVVLCHGYMGSHQDWRFQLPVLAKQYRAVTLDLRGHGSSDAPPSPRAYSIPIFAGDIYVLLQYLGINKCHLVGHSIGGFISLKFALDYPHLVSSLVIVDTASGPVDIPGYAELKVKVGQIARREGMGAAFEYNARHSPLLQRHLEKYPESLNAARRRMLQTSVDGYVYTGQAMSQRQYLSSRLGEITIPALIVIGEEDTPFLKPAEAMARAIAHARLEVIPQASHYPQEEEPERFNELMLDFLATAESR